MTDWRVGDHVDVNGIAAIIRFIGSTEFSDGIWVGVELDTPKGKNDGTVQGVQYFACPHLHGMFVRASVPRLIERPSATAEYPFARAPVVAGSRVAPQKEREPAAAAPAPTPVTKGRSMTLRSPSKPSSPVSGKAPSKGHLQSPSLSGPSTPRTTTPTVGTSRTNTPTIGGPRTVSGLGLRNATTPRSGNMGPPPAPKTGPVKRQSLTASSPSTGIGQPLSRTTSGSSAASSTAPSRPTLTGSRLGMKAGGGILRSTSGESSTSTTKVSPELRGGRARTDPATMKAQGRRGSLAVPGTASSASSTRTSPSRTPNPVAGELAAALRELDDLKAKIKFLEKKRQEDREKLKVLERVQNDRDRFESIIQTLQVKYKPQDAELKELKKQFKEMEKLVAGVEDIKAEHEAVLEMATLDREMAEEQAEAYKAELEAVRAKAEELEMEAEILREENDELGQGMTQEEKTSKGFLQMEKQNERLKDALLRLREITTQTEEELRATNASLEEEVNDLTKYKDEHEAIKQKLIASESAVEDLRNQLEAVLGAEEMLEELTERNMNMSEQIDEYRATVEDLESLKEISDELEINHVETEKQMQEDIDYREMIIAEQTKRIQQLDANTEEAEYTITRFRELVVNLQSDLEDMRASQQLTEAEAGELTARSRSMMDLNMKLQITAAKTQNKTIDLELRKLEADEAMEHLAIVQMFLPDSFHNERDSVLALLRFKRVAFKAHLLLTFVKERVQSSQLQSGHEDQLIAACDMCDKLTWVSAMCQRFIHCISSCSVAQFSRFEGALYELDPVERALNSWIEGLRRDELNEKHCVSELHRTMALMSHLGEIHLSNDLGGFASDLHMRVLLMQSCMESTAAATSLLKLGVQQKLTVSTPEDEEAAANFHKKSDAVISQSRNIKVIIAKILRSLDEFHARNLSLTTDKLQLFIDAEDATRRLADYTRSLAEVVYTLLFSNEPEEQNRAVSWGELQASLLATTERILTADEADIFGVCTRELKSLTSALADLAAVASDIDSTTEFERSPAPWTTLSQTLKTTTTVSPDTEDELRRLRDSLLESRTHLKLRVQAHDEATVKIELLESRMRNVAKQTARIEDLENSLAKGVLREKDLSEAIDSLNEEIQNLETDIAKLKKAAEDKRAVGSGEASAANEKAVATAREVAALKTEIKALGNAVRFFREENAKIRQRDAVATDSWLTEPLMPETGGRDVEKEARDVFEELRGLVLGEKVVDLNSLPQDRKAWRPKRETVRFAAVRQRERYEAVRAWKEDLVKRVKIPRTGRGGGEWEEKWAARIKPVAGGFGEVVIREPEGWERAQGVLEVEVGA